MKHRSLFKRIQNRLVLYVSAVIRLIIRVLPREKKLIVYGGALDLFIDNEKYFYIYNNNDPLMSEFRHVWLTRNEATFQRIKKLNFDVVKSNSIKGLWTMLRAGFCVFDNRPSDFTYYNLTEGACRIELWHGLPLKMFGGGKSETQKSYEEKKGFLERLLEIHYHGDYAVTTTPLLNRHLSACFMVPEEKLILSTYPRNLCFFMDEKQRFDWVKKYETSEFVAFYEKLRETKLRKVIYMPTFRDGNMNYINEAIPDWNVLNTVCKEKGVLFFLKVHRVTPIPDVTDFSNIRVLDNAMDVYPLLPLFDLLISDYSSVSCDFGLLQKPIVLYAYDVDDYVKKSRNLYQRFWQLQESLISVSSFDDLVRVLDLDDNQYKMFPKDDFFECPQNIKSLNEFIINQVKNF